jgi:hypothetical protein
VELGYEHGPAGPLVVDWLLCEARSQNPPRTGDGSVRAGYAAIAQGCYLADSAQAKRIVQTCVDLGLLDDFTDQERTFDARISGWDADVNQPLDAARKAQARAKSGRGTSGDIVGQVGTNAQKSQDVPECPPTEQDKTEQKNSNSTGNSDQIRQVFDEWVASTQRDAARTKLTPDRRRRIARALAAHGLDDCLAAVRNICRSTEARTGYGRGTRFDDVDHALSTPARVEKWRDYQPGQVDVDTARRQRRLAALTALHEERGAA